MTITQQTNRPSAERSIPVRRLDVDLSTEPGWTDVVEDDPIFSHLLVTLSSVFPRGEEFFVSTVRAHRDSVADDPALKAQVKAFAGQEAMHGREHRALNRRLTELGYRTEQGEAGIDRLLTRMERLRPSTVPLAVTAAAEHFTGVLAEAVLGDEQTLNTLFGRPGVVELISWHALEELEHKNVAFDVLVRAGGRGPARVAGWLLTFGVLAGFVALEWGRGVAGDPRARTRSARRRFRADLRRQRLLSPWFLRRSVAYLRPGFHPDDMDTEELVLRWRERLEGIATVTAGARDVA